MKKYNEKLVWNQYRKRLWIKPLIYLNFNKKKPNEVGGWCGKWEVHLQLFRKFYISIMDEMGIKFSYGLIKNSIWKTV